MKKSFSLLVLALSFSTVAVAKMDLDQMVTGGNACLGALGTYSAPQKKLSITFDEFQLSHVTDSSLARGTCSLAIPVKVAENQRLVVYNTNLLATVAIPSKASLTIKSEIFFAGNSANQVIQSSIKGPKKKTLTLTETKKKIISNCGEDVVLRAQLSLTSRKSVASSSSKVKVGSLSSLVRFESCR